MNGPSAVSSGDILDINESVTNTETNVIPDAPVEFPPTDQSDDNVSRVILDVYLRGISSKEFSETEVTFRENLAEAANVSIKQVDVRFILSVENIYNRKLLQESFLQVNTAIFGDVVQIYSNLNQSIGKGDLLVEMANDNFDLVSVIMMQPNEIVLYDARLGEAQDTESQSSSVFPPGAWVGIGAGIIVAIIVLVSFICMKKSQRKKKNIERAGNDMESKQKVQGNSTQLKGNQKGSLNSRKEFKIDAFPGISPNQSTILIPLSRDSPIKNQSFNMSGQNPQDVDSVMFHMNGLYVTAHATAATEKDSVGYIDHMHKKSSKESPKMSENINEKTEFIEWSSKKTMPKASPKVYNKQDLSKYMEC